MKTAPIARPDQLFPTGGGLDVTHHYSLLKECIRLNDSGGLAEARRLANEWVSKLTGVTAVPLDKGWLAPKLAANEPDALMNLEGRHNVVAHSLGNLGQSADFAETRKQRLPAILINGWIGYF